MPKKRKPVAGLRGGRAWSVKELATLRREFATAANRELADKLGRSLKSIIWQGAKLGLLKSPEHRSEQSRRTALATLTPEHMRTIGSAGGKIGGKARAESLKPADRKKIAKAAIKARWAKRDSNI
jgi:hypothetical protein